MQGTINFCIIAVIVIYLLGMLAIGFKFSKRQSSSEDFYLGGRKMGPIVTAMSAEASDMSSWLLMGLPGVAYLSGISDAAWTAIGLGIGTWLNWYFVSRRIRLYSSHLGAITVPEFYSKRFGDKKHILSALAKRLLNGRRTRFLQNFCHSMPFSEQSERLPFSEHCE